MSKVNINHISCIEVFVDKVDKKYEYREEKKNWLGKVIQQKGIYKYDKYIRFVDINTDGVHYFDEIEKVVRFLPHVELSLVGGVTWTERFNHIDTMNDFIKQFELPNFINVNLT